MIVSSVQPVEIHSAVCCIVCVVAIVEHMLEAYSSIGFVTALYVAYIYQVAEGWGFTLI